MRIGTNPIKESGVLTLARPCRVVVPVYIPERAGYFSESLEILQMCLESLHLTAGNNVAITVVSNGCAQEVLTALESMFARGWIDQLVLSRENLGKTGAIASVLKGAPEELLAWTDCDVLFKLGWIEAVVKVFHAFPECGAVAPFPGAHLPWHHTSATMLGAWASRCIAREGVVPIQDLDDFSRSVGTPGLFKSGQKESQWIVRRENVKACIGAGHFVCCIRPEVVKGMPDEPCTAALNGEADRKFLDLPPERCGLWRLSLPRAYVWHMGNTTEPWMRKYVEQLRLETYPPGMRQLRLPPSKRPLASRVPLRARTFAARVLKKLLESTRKPAVPVAAAP